MSFQQAIDTHLSTVFDAISDAVDSGVLSGEVKDLAMTLMEAWPDGPVYSEAELIRMFTFPVARSALHTLRSRYALPVAESRDGFWIVRTPEEAKEFETRFRHRLPEHVSRSGLAQGEALRDDGLRRALSGKDEWVAVFEAEAKRQLRAKGTVTSNDVIEVVGMPPGHPNAVGAAIRKFAGKENLVIIRHEKSESVSRHAGRTAVWGRA